MWNGWGGMPVPHRSWETIYFAIRGNALNTAKKFWGGC